MADVEVGERVYWILCLVGENRRMIAESQSRPQCGCGSHAVYITKDKWGREWQVCTVCPMVEALWAQGWEDRRRDI